MCLRFFAVVIYSPKSNGFMPSYYSRLNFVRVEIMDDSDSDCVMVELPCSTDFPVAEHLIEFLFL